MKCPKCGYEPRDRLLHTPCPNPECGYIWIDTESYVTLLAAGLNIETALDIGCGNKGVIAQYYWEHVAKIKKGYACDIHVIKALPPVWEPLKMDAEGLLERLGPRSVDFVTHCGMLEHVDYEKALRILRVIEQVARQKVFFTCSTIMREVDYKVKRDGNPYHYYKSFWDVETFRALGYYVNVDDMVTGRTFGVEVPVSYVPDEVAALEPWETRVGRAIEVLRARTRCYVGCTGPEAEPVGWDPKLPGSGIFCYHHMRDAIARQESKHVQRPWEIKDFPIPPWRNRI